MLENGGVILHQALADNQRFNYTIAKFIIGGILNPEPLTHPINGRPVLHHLLNMYWQSRDQTQKAELVDIILLCIKKGAPVDEAFEGEPDAISKSILMREMSVAKALTKASKGINIDVLKLRELYSIPCNPTPLVKLLLHADTIVRQKTLESMGGVKGLKTLLAGAHLEGQNPVVQAKDLGKYSTTHNTVLGRLGINDHADIRLHEIMTSLAEVASSVHKLILSSPSATPEALASTLSQPLGGDRNVLHVLAMSGAGTLMHELAQAVEAFAPTAEGAKAKEVIASALTTKGEH